MTKMDEIWKLKNEESSAVIVNVPPGLFVSEQFEKSLPRSRNVVLWCVGGEFILYWADPDARVDGHEVSLSSEFVDVNRVGDIEFAGQC